MAEQIRDGVSCAEHLRGIVSQADPTKMCSPQRKLDLQNQFDHWVVEELYYLIGCEVERNCHGCIINHPSQYQHDCCFMAVEEHVNMFIHLAFRKMDEFDVLAKWYPSLKEAEEADMVESYRLWKTINDARYRLPTPETLQHWSEKVIKAQTS